MANQEWAPIVRRHMPVASNLSGHRLGRKRACFVFVGKGSGVMVVSSGWRIGRVYLFRSPGVGLVAFLWLKRR